MHLRCDTRDTRFDASMRKRTPTRPNKRKNVITKIYETRKLDLVIQLVIDRRYSLDNANSN